MPAPSHAVPSRLTRKFRPPRFGLGGSPIGDLPDPDGDARATATIDAAYGAGIRFFDTAPQYGAGRSEQRLGIALAKHARAREVLILLEPTQKVARRMAVAAVAEAFDQIRATIPRSRLGGIGRVRALLKVQLAPPNHRHAYIEGEIQMVDVHGIAHGFDRAQIREDRVDVRARDPGVKVVGHGRIHVLAAFVHAVVQGAVEIVGRPTPDACVRIGRDVWRHHVAERRIEA